MSASFCDLLLFSNQPLSEIQTIETFMLIWWVYQIIFQHVPKYDLYLSIPSGQPLKPHHTAKTGKKWKHKISTFYPFLSFQKRTMPSNAKRFRIALRSPPKESIHLKSRAASTASVAMAPCDDKTLSRSKQKLRITLFKTINLLLNKRAVLLNHQVRSSDYIYWRSSWLILVDYCWIIRTFSPKATSSWWILSYTSKLQLHILIISGTLWLFNIATCDDLHFQHGNVL